MYLGLWRLDARKPAPLLAGSEKCASEVSKSGLTFISRTQDGNFDDLVTWIVPSILKSKMVAAGRLP
jgi:hypothetical protein